MNITYSQYQLEFIVTFFAIYFISMFIMGWYKLTPKPLYKHAFFWASTSLPIIIFFILAAFDIKNGETLTTIGKFHQLAISTFAFSTLALIIPIVSIIASIHRSIQTDEQIRVTEKKNESDKYYAHQKYIVESLNSLNKQEIAFSFNDKTNKKSIYVSNPHKLYSQAFTHASPENADFTLSPKINEMLTSFWKWLNREFKIYNKEKLTYKSANFVYETEGRLFGFSRHLGVSRPFGAYSANIKINDYNLTTSFMNEKDFLRTIYCYNEVTSDICDVLGIEIDFRKICPDIMNYIYGSENYPLCFQVNFTSYITHTNAILLKNIKPL